MSDEVLAAVKLGIVQRLTHALLDVQVLRLIREKPLWGYALQKRVREQYGVKVGHGKLYSLLGYLEKMGFVVSVQESGSVSSQRFRTVYAITDKGLQYLNIYEDVVMEQCFRKETPGEVWNLLQSFVSSEQSVHS